MKKIFSLMLCMMAAVSFVACGHSGSNDPKEDDTNALVGTWDATVIEYYAGETLVMSQYASDMFDVYAMEFKTDSTGSLTMGSEAVGMEEDTVIFTYSIEEKDGVKYLILLVDGQAEQKIEIRDITENGFSLVVPEEEPQEDVVYLEVTKFERRK